MHASQQPLHELRSRNQWPGCGGQDRRRRPDQDDHRRVSTRGSTALVVAFTAYWLAALPLDSVSSAQQQLLLISLSAWVFLAIALALQSPAVRVQVLTLVC